MPAKLSVEDLLLKWASEPVAFVEEALGATPEKWQAEVLNNIIKHDRIAVRSGHGVGKSALLAWIILWWMVTRYPQKIACTAPSAHQLSDVLWGEVSYWSKKLPDVMSFKGLFDIYFKQKGYSKEELLNVDDFSYETRASKEKEYLGFNYNLKVKPRKRSRPRVDLTKPERTNKPRTL